MNSKAKRRFNEKLQTCSQNLPDEFNQNMKEEFKKMIHWKANELRTFLLYCGPVDLLSSVAPVLYQE